MAADPKSNHTRYRVGAFVFDTDSGELTGNEPQDTRKLAFQPAALLQLLVERAGELVTHETIRTRLWPDAFVEYDQGVHYCMRQIRLALDDSARAPNYIETMPKRGYRLLAETSRIENDSQSQEPDAAPVEPVEPNQEDPVLPEKNHRGTHLKLIVALVLLVAVVGFGINAIASHTPRKQFAQANETTIVILPFVSQLHPSMSDQTNSIATYLVAELGKIQQLMVIGPSTTSRFTENESLKSITNELSADYLVNPRFVSNDEGVRVLIELIRASDGRHIWTMWLDSPFETQDISATIAEAVTNHCR